MFNIKNGLKTHCNQCIAMVATGMVFLAVGAGIVGYFEPSLTGFVAIGSGTIGMLMGSIAYNVYRCSRQSLANQSEVELQRRMLSNLENLKEPAPVYITIVTSSQLPPPPPVQARGSEEVKLFKIKY